MVAKYLREMVGTKVSRLSGGSREWQERVMEPESRSLERKARLGSKTL